MGNKLISELPNTPARDVAVEADRKGCVAVGDCQYFTNEAIHFLGLCQIVHELRERIAELEHPSSTKI